MVRGKRHAASIGGEMEPITLEDLDEVDLLLTELEISQGKGNLILCIVASPAYRERIIEVIKARFPCRVKTVEKGDDLISDLRNVNPKAEEILIWTLPETLSKDILDALNNFRELFYDAGVPSLVFMTPAALDDVIWKAPDFWRYRGGYHILKGEDHGQAYQAVEALSMPLNFSYQNKDELLRRKRINEHLLEKIKNKSEKEKILLELGTVHSLLGELHKATNRYEQSLALAREIGDSSIEENALGNMGNACVILGKTADAIEYYEQALAIARKIGDRQNEGVWLSNLGSIYTNQVKTLEAIEYFKHALSIAIDIKDRRGEGNRLANLGNAFIALGEPRKAIRYFEQALVIHRKIYDLRGEESDLGNLGLAYSNMGETLKAIDYYEQALAIARKIGDVLYQGAWMGNLGLVYFNLGKTHKAIDCYKQALAIAREIGDMRNEGVWLNNLGLTYSNLGKTQKAIEFMKAAYEIFKQIESPYAEQARKQLAKWQGDDSKK
jgi:tetratricopeptide (TPR) repeat protein